MHLLMFSRDLIIERLTKQIKYLTAEIERLKLEVSVLITYVPKIVEFKHSTDQTHRFA